MIPSNPEFRPFAVTPSALAAAPFVLVTFAYALGIAVALTFDPHLWLQSAVLLVGACGLVNAVVQRNRSAGWAWGTALLFGVGIVRTTIAAPSPGERSAAQFVGQRVLLEGVVVAEPLDRSGVAVLRVRPMRLSTDAGSNSIDDVVLLRIADSGGTWRYGDVLQVEGELETPPRIEDFDYRMYLARQGVFAWMPRAQNAQHVGRAPPSLFWERMLDAKDAVRRSVRAVVPAPESALLNGILIGDDDAMPEPLVEAFRRTGTSHIISISGFNVGVIVGMVLAVVRRLMHPRRAVPALLALLWLYAVFVGGSASVVRAVAMTSIALVGQWLWKRGFTLNTLCAAAFFMLVVQPFYLVDVGFQLSFGATLGLVLVADVLTKLVPPVLMRTRLLSTVIEGVLLTTAAQITTLPFMLIHYEQISLITLLTNGLVLPLQPPIMGLGIVGALVGLVSTELGTLASLPVFALLRASIRLVEITADVPWAALPLGRVGVGWGIAYYVALCGGLGLRTLDPPIRRELWRLLRRRAAALGIGAAAAAALAYSAGSIWSRPPPAPQIWLRGSSTLLLTPDGAQIVVLGDGDPLGLVTQKLPTWDYSVDALVVPRLDARTQDQALAFLRTYAADRVIIPRPMVTTDTLYLFWTKTPPARVAHVQVAIPDALLWKSSDDEGVEAVVVAGADARFGGAMLGMRLNGPGIRADLLAAGELTPSTVHDAGQAEHSLLFTAPTASSQRLIRDLPLDWLIWTREPDYFPHSARHVLNMESNAQIGFQIRNGTIIALP